MRQDKLLRVGFMLNASAGSLLGATNYYHNLIKVLARSKRVQPVLLTAGELPSAICDGLPPTEIVTNRYSGVSGFQNLARRAVKRIIGRDLILEQVLKQNNIDLFSHSGHLGKYSRIATVPWIPDFQHFKLPEFFSKAELNQRDRYFRQIAEAGTLVIVSSQAALADFEAFMPTFAHKGRVLHFISFVTELQNEELSSLGVQERYNLEQPYFFLPNHFWKHKNHRVVIEALRIARSRGRPLKVIATGHLEDRRHPAHVDELRALVKSAGCENDFIAAGVVPYADVATLMHCAVAVLNPSLFEGWSTSVEESKALGKAVILSDIKVHREQAPRRGFYFDPNNAEMLLNHMTGLLQEFSPLVERRHRQQALQQRDRRREQFLFDCEEIYTEAHSLNEGRWGF